MALDFNKCVNASLMPAAVLIVVGLVSTLAGHFVPTLACLLGLPMLLIELVVLAWAGYVAAKELKMDLVGGAVTGALAGAISAVIGGILNLLLAFVGIGTSGLGAAGVAIDATVLAVAAVIGIVIGLVLGAIMGAIMGAIGAFVAGMKK
jgi:hypothetical protein